MTRRRCWDHDWVVEFDIRGLFDNLDHDLLMKALRKHCQERWILLYVDRWLKAPMQTTDGQKLERAGDHPDIQFTFLGYTFRPRNAVDKYGRVYVNFSPAVSREAHKAMRQTIRGWHLQLKSDKDLADLSVTGA